MRHISITGPIVLATLTISLVAAATALALPDVSISLGGTYPIHAQGSNAATSLIMGTASGVALEGTGVTILTLVKELTSLGEFTATFTKIHEPGKPAELCHTEGDVAGAALVTGIFHVVLTSKPEQLAMLFLINTFELICPKSEIACKGSVLSTLNAGTEKEELTKSSGKLNGTKGKQELSEFINDGGTISKTQLLTNAGAGFVLSDQNIAEEVKAEVLEGKMLIITGR